MRTPAAELVSEVESRIRSAAHISLFLDFDGTLVPISPLPDVPALDPQIIETLTVLSRRERVVTTIISGRAIIDLRARIRLDGVIYAGNHGLEICGRQLQFVEPRAAERREPLERVCQQLEQELSGIRGVYVERKGLTASVHYRLAPEEERERIADIIQGAVRRYEDLFRVTPGRKLLNIVPAVDWNKGAAVGWINERLAHSGPLLSIYLGDDATDEDAFQVLEAQRDVSRAITVKVGQPADTCAHYHLPDPSAVHEFLLWLSQDDGR
jgi:trehalose 6-phosphate phosphatase